jgi:hypothetical protein
MEVYGFVEVKLYTFKVSLLDGSEWLALQLATVPLSKV